MKCERSLRWLSRIAGDVLEKLAEGLAEREDLAQIVSGEVGAGFFGVRTFTADLNDANNLVAGEDRRADHLLNEFGTFAANFHTFKNRGVADAGEIIDDVRAAFTGGFRGNGGSTGKWDKAYLFERFGNEEMQVAPAMGNAHESNFVGFYGEIFGDTLGDARE